MGWMVPAAPHAIVEPTRACLTNLCIGASDLHIKAPTTAFAGLGPRGQTLKFLRQVGRLLLGLSFSFAFAFTLLLTRRRGLGIAKVLACALGGGCSAAFTGQKVKDDLGVCLESLPQGIKREPAGFITPNPVRREF